MIVLLNQELVTKAALRDVLTPVSKVVWSEEIDCSIPLGQDQHFIFFKFLYHAMIEVARMCFLQVVVRNQDTSRLKGLRLGKKQLNIGLIIEKFH